MNRVTKVAFIGGNRYSEDGPLLTFMDICRDRNFVCSLITDDEHLAYNVADGRLFIDVLTDRNIDFVSVDNPNDVRFIQLLKSADLIFSVNCPWILKKDILKS